VFSDRRADPYFGAEVVKSTMAADLALWDSRGMFCRFTRFDPTSVIRLTSVGREPTVS
jgi:hypothetical protein